MREKFLAFVLSAVMMISVAAPAFAAEFSSGDDTAVFAQEQQAAGIFSDSAGSEFGDETAELFDESERETITDADIQALLGSSDDLELVCITKPLTRPNEFTPIGNGCDIPTVEEVIASAGPELFAAGPEQDSVNQADEAAIYNAVAEIRDAMVKRKSALEFTLKLSFEVEDWDELTWNLLLLALEETGNPCEGDYLRWQFEGADEGYVIEDEEKGYYNYKPISFYTTYAQEEAVTSKVNTALAGMKFTDQTTPYMKIRKIYDYICRTVTYDDEHVNDPAYIRQFTAYGAIIDKTAVCQGYSLLLYRMLMEAEIENRMIPSQCHIWNLVYLRGSYYNVDATWDAECDQSGYEWFLKGSSSFEQNEEHIRENNEMFGDYNSAEFKELYPASQTDYVVQPSDTRDCTHTWSAWETVLKADCMAEGVRGRACTNCGLEEYELTAKASHKWKYTSNKNNTHTMKCSVCGTSKSAKCTFTDHICTKCKGRQVLSKAKISRISSAGYNKLKITWRKVTGASGYDVQYLKGGTWKTIKTASGTSYTHTGNSAYPIKTGMTYYYRVRAYYTLNGKNVYGAYSTKEGGKAVPARPELVSVTPKSYNQITLQWKKAAGAAAYIICRKNGTRWEQIDMVTGGSTTSYTHTSSGKYPIIAGTSYTYTVRSYIATGNTKGLYDSTGMTVKTSIGKPSIALSKSGKGVKISWKRTAGATGYQIQRYSNRKWSVVKTVGSGTISYLDEKVKKGTTYQYRIRAYRKYDSRRVYGRYSTIKKLAYK